MFCNELSFVAIIALIIILIIFILTVFSKKKENYSTLNQQIPLKNQIDNPNYVYNEQYNLGSSNNRWKDLYLSGNSLHLSNLVISSTNNNLTITDNFNNLAPITVSQLRIQSDSSNYSILSVNSNGLFITNRKQICPIDN